MTLLMLDGSIAQATCERCGYQWQLAVRNNQEDRERLRLCSSCKAKPVHDIHKNGIRCTPWSGEVDLDTMQPLKNGEPYLPGERTCGHADCVTRDHIKTEPAERSWTAEELLAEQCSLFYRTGKNLTYKQLLAKLEKERRN